MLWKREVGNLLHTLSPAGFGLEELSIHTLLSAPKAALSSTETGLALGVVEWQGEQPLLPSEVKVIALGDQLWNKPKALQKYQLMQTSLVPGTEKMHL